MPLSTTGGFQTSSIVAKGGRVGHVPPTPTPRVTGIAEIRGKKGKSPTVGFGGRFSGC